MFYTIYKITNILNGKIYIGKHQTKDLNDDYMGSGKLLRRAIAKYGQENFTKEILFQFDNEVDMNAKEAELVTEEFCLREDTNYNLCPGGHGGFGYINKNVLVGDRRLEVNRQNIQKAMSSEARGKAVKNTDYSKIGFSVTPKEKLATIGIKSAQKYREGIKADPTKYKTVCITNGEKNKRITPVDECPPGWWKGRTYISRK